MSRQLVSRPLSHVPVLPPSPSPPGAFTIAPLWAGLQFGTNSTICVFVYSEEHPDFTGYGSGYNDRMLWHISATGNATMDGVPYVPMCDNNGNVTRYLDPEGNVVAWCVYSAFGETLSMTVTGFHSRFTRHRFSTKYYDEESGLCYYGYRFYSPSLMRWLNRDPIEEEGSLNLYAMCGNDAVETYDYLGLKWNIRRSGGIFAYAIPDSEADTFQGLADIVELDSTDYMKWAHTKDTSPRKCRVYLIPNLKVYHKGVRRFYENWSINIIGMWDSKNGQQMSKDRTDGFKVVLKNSISGADVLSALSTDGLYEYTFTGHGKNGGIAAESKNVLFGPRRITIYGIHKLTLQACDSFNDIVQRDNVICPGWAANVATVGNFVGYIGAARLIQGAESKKRSRSGTNSGETIITRGTNK